MQKITSMFSTVSSNEVCTLYHSCPNSNTKISSLQPPPIGVFWDIENCQVPRGKSALVAVQCIRDRFFSRFMEADFVCICDIRKESPQVIQELNDAQVSVIHVSGNSKNAADDKLRQAMRRYADIYSQNRPPCAQSPCVLLISGDINFSTDLSDLRYRKRLYVVLLHNKHAPDALIICAHEHYDFHSILENLPDRPVLIGKDYFQDSKGIPLKGGHCPMEIIVTDLPTIRNVTKLKKRLKRLSDNCGGKVITIEGQFAVLRFPNQETALRASKRMNGEDVFGSKIRVLYSSQMELKNSAPTNGFLPSESTAPVPYKSVQPTSLVSLPHTSSGSSSSEKISPSLSVSGYVSGSSPSSTGAHYLQVQTQRPAPTNSGSSSSSEKGNLQAGYKTRNGYDNDSFDLHVTNIDSTIGDWKVIRQTLMSAFGEHVTVRGVWVYSGQDGAISAIIRVSNKEEAHYAVAQLHRRSLGTKRIFISFGQGISIDQATVKKEVAALLLDVPNHTLPLFKFREMFEKRYRRSISASDLYRMKDVITISDTSASNGLASVSSTFGSNGRSITLTHEWQAKEDDTLDVHCKIHPPLRAGIDKARQGWAEKEVGTTLPNVTLELKPFTKKVHQMLQSHSGGFPLLSFLDCYESEFGVLEVAEEGTGVPLEHFIACVQGVEIAFSENGMKRVQWSERKELDTGLSQAMAVQLAQLSRELVDLLKTFPKCSLPFSKLIPAYHHHFGRQCRVADYGHFSLSALLQTLPLTIQIMGEAQDRIITLAHRAQMKRFATDLIRVLKAQGGAKKHIRMDDFTTAFSQVFPTRQFCAEDYGLCYFTDLVFELIENSSLVALIKDEDGAAYLAIPKREQTAQEIHRTRIFGTEVLDLLSHSIRCEMPFSKFIPAYHHHFGRQCRVSDYGFTKLAELFEAVGDTVCIVSPNSNPECSPEDKIIRLTPKEQIKVVGEQVWKLVEKREVAGVGTQVSDLSELFLDEYGFVLRPDLCDAANLNDLIENKLGCYVQVEGEELISVDRVKLEQFVQDAKSILEEQPSFTMDCDEFINEFSEKFDRDLDMDTIQKNLAHLVIITEETQTRKKVISLAPLRVFGRELTELLVDAGGYLSITNVEAAYLQKFGRPIRPAQLGYPTLLALLQSLPDSISIRGKYRAKRVVLNKGSAAEVTSANYSTGYNFGKGTRPHSCMNAKNNREMNGQHSKPQHSVTPFWTSNSQNVVGPPMYSPTLTSPNYSMRPGESNVFTFDRPPNLSPPMYDMWMRDGPPVSPPLTPPVVWAYHPMSLLTPGSPTPLGTGPNLLMPTFSFGSQWSPPPSRTMMPTYDHAQPQK